MANRPLIGITSSAHRVSPSYILLWLAVRLAGGRPCRIGVRQRGGAELVDGVILAGGNDVSPSLFNRSRKPLHRYDPARDALELRVLRVARQRRIPVLGICRGAQLMNIAHGGTIHMAVRKAYRNARYPHHPLAHLTFRKLVEIVPGSLFARVMGVSSLMVNSLHRQSIDDPGDGIAVTAREVNGVAQAIEDSTMPFYLGVQFHPELMLYRAAYRRLLRTFIGSAAEETAERSGQHPG
ncbi:MAG: gamma-glutamyl-gamma-aminobutyrate hydrolase family protein [Spirochaetaceae bacterium]|nr:MAG: gamma-glutamyl-gamma-aminobutyrate hydrolase family protein [Spirochaetaceae bacterium]